MKTAKKFIALSLCFLMIFPLLVGCGSTQADTKPKEGTNTEAAPAGPAKSEDVYTVRFGIYDNGDTMADWPVVLEKLNPILREKIGVELEIVLLPIPTFHDSVQMKVISGEKLDLVVVQGDFMAQDIARGMLTDITDLLEENAPELVDDCGSYLDAEYVDGRIYAVPTIRDMANAGGIIYRKDLVDASGYDMGKIKSCEDLTDFFAAMKAAYPDMIITRHSMNPNSIAGFMRNYDPRGDSIGVLMNYGQGDFQVVNLFETEEYARQIRLVRDWYEAGYVMTDGSLSTEDAFAQIASDRLFSCFATLKPGQDTGMSGMVEKDMKQLILGSPMLTTASITSVGLGIPVTCENPAKTLQFLNLLYSDEEVINMIDYGLEGVHYVKTDVDNVITNPEGMTSQTNPFGHNFGFIFGDQLKSFVKEPDAPDLYVQLREFNESGLPSKAIGFSFNSENVSAEYTAVNNVLNQYRLSLENGEVDCDVVLPEFIQALKAAGIDRIIAEKQAQLDAWVAAQ